MVNIACERELCVFMLVAPTAPVKPQSNIHEMLDECIYPMIQQYSCSISLQTVRNLSIGDEGVRGYKSDSHRRHTEGCFGYLLSCLGNTVIKYTVHWAFKSTYCSCCPVSWSCPSHQHCEQHVWGGPSHTLPRRGAPSPRGALSGPGGEGHAPPRCKFPDTTLSPGTCTHKLPITMSFFTMTTILHNILQHSLCLRKYSNVSW